MTRTIARLVLCLALLLPSALFAQDGATGAFSVTIDPALQATPYSGRVYLVFGRQGSGEPRKKMSDWFNPPQVLAQDVSGVKPGEPILLTAPPLGFPAAYADMEAGDCTVQAIVRRSLDCPRPGEGEGDLYSRPVRCSFVPGNEGVLKIDVTQVVHEKAFVEGDRMKFIEIPSPSLTAFHGREYKIRAAVMLPTGWTDDPTKSWPTLYSVPGFGGSHHSAVEMTFMIAQVPGANDILHVYLDPTCALGHSVFADSANNGPWGKALTEELIPEIERRFHGAQTPSKRFVWGMSSGGWSSLWLQVHCPDLFAGCWSFCPDPVDFRDFQYIDLYDAKQNFDTLPDGSKRPLARRKDTVTLWYKDFVAMEEVWGDGGQIHSFEATFSPRGADGRPLPVFDRKTGAVDTAVAKTWEQYDIRLVLERNWAALGPKLKGKLHIFAGGKDTFYLEGAVVKLKESLAKLGSDAEVEIVPDAPHTIFPAPVNRMMEAVAKAK